MFLNKSINARGKLIALHPAKVMGIVNVNEDSFYNQSRKSNLIAILEQVEKMLHDGVDIVDLGAISTRPQANLETEALEWERLVGVVEAIKLHFPELLISVDTFRYEIAKRCYNEGADIINDVSAGDYDPKMLPFIAEKNIPYIAMHSYGLPAHITRPPSEKSMIEEVYLFFQEKIEKWRNLAIHDIILDPGFGFGKTLEENFHLLSELRFLEHLNKPILVGISRKSMLTKILQINTQDALNATSIANTIALIHGAHILRVHDVKEAVECVKICTALNQT